jgi:hypothetical protein
MSRSPASSGVVTTFSAEQVGEELTINRSAGGSADLHQLLDRTGASRAHHGPVAPRDRDEVPGCAALQPRRPHTPCRRGSLDARRRWRRSRARAAADARPLAPGACWRLSSDASVLTASRRPEMDQAARARRWCSNSAVRFCRRPRRAPVSALGGEQRGRGVTVLLPTRPSRKRAGDRAGRRGARWLGLGPNPTLEEPSSSISICAFDAARRPSALHVSDPHHGDPRRAQRRSCITSSRCRRPRRSIFGGLHDTDRIPCREISADPRARCWSVRAAQPSSSTMWTAA